MTQMLNQHIWQSPSRKLYKVNVVLFVMQKGSVNTWEHLITYEYTIILNDQMLRTFSLVLGCYLGYVKG